MHIRKIALVLILKWANIHSLYIFPFAYLTHTKNMYIISTFKYIYIYIYMKI